MKKFINFRDTKRGVASLYVVIFATILFGVITLSFIRLILSESSRSSDDELSQSAYDSALAGVEDAKRAIKKYYDSLDAGAPDDGKLFDSECNMGIYKVLGVGSGSGGEVSIGSSTVNGVDMNQAYTCVVMTKQTEDYRSTISSENRTRIIPLGVNTTSLSKVKEVEFSWFTTVNDVQYQGLNFPGFTNAVASPIPPVVQLTLISMGGETYTPKEQSADGSFDEGPGYNSTMILYPEQRSTCAEVAASDDGTACTNTVNASSNASANETHIPYRIECANANEAVTEFACTAKIQVSFADKDTAFLVASLPYGDTITGFAAKLRGDSGSGSDIITFDGAQVSIDSTGRANDLYRRVETRVDIADIYFPIPQYALDIGGSGDNSMEKRHWITANCWTEKGACDNNGKVSDEELNDGQDSLTEDSDSLDDETFLEILDPEKIQHDIDRWTNGRR